MVLTEKQQWIYNNFLEQAKVLTKRAEAANGRLSELEFYNLKYRNYPYLLLETDDVIAKRMADVLINSIDIDKDGRICGSKELELSKHNELYHGLMSEIKIH